MIVKGLEITNDLFAVMGLVGFLVVGTWVALGFRLGGRLRSGWEHFFGVAGLGLVLIGQYAGIYTAPSERMMGEVYRILYVHVPSAWLTMVVFLVCFIASLGYLWSGKKGWDLTVEATAEVGVVLAALLQITGMLFARPTWGVYWDWDPRLVSTAVMMLSFIGVLTLRSLVDEPDRRATWTSVGAILATTSMAVTYYSVRWWRSVHQMQSSPDTVGDPIVLVLRVNAFAFLFLSIWFVARRWRIAAARARAEEAPPLPPEVPA